MASGALVGWLYLDWRGNERESAALVAQQAREGAALIAHQLWEANELARAEAERKVASEQQAALDAASLSYEQGKRERAKLAELKKANNIAESAARAAAHGQATDRSDAQARAARLDAQERERQDALRWELHQQRLREDEAARRQEMFRQQLFVDQELARQEYNRQEYNRQVAEYNRQLALRRYYYGR